MADTQNSEVITVRSSPVGMQVETTVGQLVPLIGGVVLAFGVLTPTKWAAIAAILPIAANYGWRIYSTLRRHNAMVALADAAPDSVGQVLR
jgi:Na+/H+ antiporter NhaC